MPKEKEIEKPKIDKNKLKKYLGLGAAVTALDLATSGYLAKKGYDNLNN